jgi:hypothetical protein
MEINLPLPLACYMQSPACYPVAMVNECSKLVAVVGSLQRGSTIGKLKVEWGEVANLTH